MRFDILTLFPHIFNSYFSESILKRAQEAGKIEIVTHNIRDYATDKHKTTDDIPYGGGAGMVMKVEPIYRALCEMGRQVQELQDVRRKGQEIENGEWKIENKDPIPTSNLQIQNSKVAISQRIILFSAKGKRFTQRDAERLAQYDRLILICGRYEGVDERVAEHLADEEISIGEYILTGGEIPAMALVDSVTRLLPGVLGNEESLREESFSNMQQETSDKKEGKRMGYEEQVASEEKSSDDMSSKLQVTSCGRLEYPQYTRPEEFNGWRVPKVLLSGNHKEIEKWRNKNRS